MRVHSIEIAGFGPFGDTQKVGFDALNEAGLFLLSGPTGAGKTSVLDAICFALYGEVPGARELGKGGADLVSEQREGDLEPSVTLVATIGERRIRIHRSMRHERPSHRGEGTVTEDSKAVLEVWEKGEYVVRASRRTEVNVEVAEWVGMKRDQFSQVVMLPQGEFATFLRANSKDRRVVLEKLFESYDFGGVEDWFKNRASETREEVALAARKIDDELLAAEQFANAATGEAEAATETDRDASEAECLQRPNADQPGAVLGWIGAAGKSLADRRKEIEKDRKKTASALRKAESALAAATTEAERVKRRREADTELAELEARGAWREQVAEEIEDANRAMAVRPHVEALDEAGSTEAALRTERRLQEPRLAELELIDADHKLIRKQQKVCSDEAAVLASFESKELAELTDLRETLKADSEKLGEKKSLRDEAAEVARDGPKRLKALEEELHMASKAEIQLTAEMTSREASRAKHLAAIERDQLQPALAGKEREVTSAHSAENAAHELVLSLHERRLNGMAAELAGGLEDGVACPVCGSTEHAMPARASEDAVTTEDEEGARAKLDKARELHLITTKARDDLDHRIKLLDHQAGSRSEPDLAAELKEAGEKAEKSRMLAESGTGIGEQIKQLEKEIKRSAETLDGIEAELSEVQRAIDRVGARIGEIGNREIELRSSAVSIAEARERVEDLAEFLDQAARTRESLNEAVRKLEKTRSKAESEAARHGFESLADATSSTRSDDALATLREQLEVYKARLAVVRGQLKAPDLAEVDPKAEIDLAPLETARAEAEAIDVRVLEQLGKLRDAEQQFGVKTDGIPTSLEKLGPLVHQARLIQSLSDLVRGKSAANTRRMQLSTYVLAARLEQVVAAANLHLAKMSSGRYSLAHSDATEAGNVASGLGITVFDAHTGGERPTRTLSGGESFYASLSLALGLAEIVKAGAGGRDIDTLFVDEGFGSLDSETLDEVMSVLDELRAGGRTVGVVSHVEELKNRIPVQLEVTKSDTGSSLQVIGG